MAVFPTPLRGGPPYDFYMRVPREFSDTTIINRFEDGGASFNETGASDAQFYVLRYRLLTESEFATLLTHYDGHRKATGFDFYPPRKEPADGTEGSLIADVHYLEFNRLDHNKYWSSAVNIRLVKYPA